jgi:uncharacterized protein
VIFIDTGAFLARYVEKDQFHHHALVFWSELETQRKRLVTSNFVLDETATLLGRRTGHGFAAKRLQNIYASSLIQILRSEKEDELRALDLFIKFADQSVSFTDCVSFVLMTRSKIKQVFSFDRHFDSAGFMRMP